MRKITNFCLKIFIISFTFCQKTPSDKEIIINEFVRSSPQQQTQVTCKQERGGRREHDQCKVISYKIGSVFTKEHGKARKIVMSKPSTDSGEEVVTMRKGREYIKIIIKPGESKEVFYNDNCNGGGFLYVETTKLGTDQKSEFDVRYEWCR